MGTNKITGLGDPTLAQDAATKNYIDTIFGSTTTAAASAAAAAASASAASSSASSASGSATAAASSASAAAASFDSFDDRYLGAKASDPTVDNDGNALLTGALYWNTTSNAMKVYDGSAWVAAYLPTAGFAQLGAANVFTANQTITDNSSNAALKITQTGSGNALYIEDVAADATPFVVSSTGAVGIGTTTPDNVTSAGIALVSNDGYYPQVVNRNKTNDANASYMVFDKDRASAIVQSGDNLGNIVWRSFDGANYLQSAAIIGYSDGAPGTNDVPGALSFLTTADGASAPTERVRIASTGAVAFNGSYGTSGQVLTSGGAGAAPTWAAPPASAGTVTAVASGSLSDGTKVVINSDGTVSAVTTTAASSFTKIAGPTDVTSSDTTSSRYGFSCAYSSVDNRVLLTWVNSSANFIYGAVGILNGTTITFGAITTLYTGGVYTTYSGVQTIYASVSNRFVLSFYRSSDGSYTQSLWSINTSTNVPVFQSSTSPGSTGNYSYFSTCYDPVNNQVFTVKYNSIGYVSYCLTSVTTSSISQGAQGYVEYGSTAQQVSCAYCEGIGKFAIVYRNASGYPVVKIGTASAGAASFGNETVLNSQATYTSSYSSSAVAYSTAAGQLFVNYTKTGSSYFFAKAGTISGTDVTFGAEGYSNYISNGYYPYYGMYDSSTSTVLIGNIYGAQSITFPSANNFTAADTLTASTSYSQQTVASSIGLVFSTGSNGAPVALEAFRGYTTNLTASNFLGISNGAYTNGQTATIQTVGSTDDAQSGLTAGTKYYVSDFGTLSSTATTQPYAGLAVSATKLVIKG
jgi:hypothetical protein